MMRLSSLLLAGAALYGASALAQAPTPAKSAAAPVRPAIKLKWSTASEVDNYGFFVMRGDTKEGPFKQVNDKALPGGNNSDVPRKYEFDDPDVKEGQTYYYFIESISTQGVREKFSPVLSKVCCNRPEPPKLEESPDGHGPPPTPPSAPAPTTQTVSGTGFFVSEDGFLVTNEHVVHGAVDVRVSWKTEILPARILAVDIANDLAILKVEGRFSALALADASDIKVGTTVFTVGFPNPSVQGLQPKTTRGEINSITGIRDDPRYLQISLPVQPGNSGGPLASLRGAVAGVVTSRLNDLAVLKQSGSLPQNVNYAIKSSYLSGMLAALKERPVLPKPGTTALGLEAAAELVEQSVVRVTAEVRAE